VQTVCAAIEAGINAPVASSTGRLFEAVAVALGYAPSHQSWEGEAAMQLEHAAVGYIHEHGLPEPLSFMHTTASGNQDLAMVDPAALWDALIEEIQAGMQHRAAAKPIAFQSGYRYARNGRQARTAAFCCATQ